MKITTALKRLSVDLGREVNLTDLAKLFKSSRQLVSRWNSLHDGCIAPRRMAELRLAKPHWFKK